MLNVERLRVRVRAGDNPILEGLLSALEEESEFPVTRLYDLPHDEFELAVAAIREWRAIRYVVGPKVLAAQLQPLAAWRR